jgi:hypothetical protein
MSTLLLRPSVRPLLSVRIETPKSSWINRRGPCRSQGSVGEMSTTEVKLSDIADAKLKSATGETIVAKELWKDHVRS